MQGDTRKEKPKKRKNGKCSREKYHADKRTKKQPDTDLRIIAGVSVSVLAIYTISGKCIDRIVSDTSILIVWQVLFVGGVFQFDIAGPGITMTISLLI